MLSIAYLKTVLADCRHRGLMRLPSANQEENIKSRWRVFFRVVETGEYRESGIITYTYTGTMENIAYQLVFKRGGSIYIKKY